MRKPKVSSPVRRRTRRWSVRTAIFYRFRIPVVSEHWNRWCTKCCSGKCRKKLGIEKNRWVDFLIHKGILSARNKIEARSIVQLQKSVYRLLEWIGNRICVSVSLVQSLFADYTLCISLQRQEKITQQEQQGSSTIASVLEQARTMYLPYPDRGNGEGPVSQ